MWTACSWVADDKDRFVLAGLQVVSFAHRQGAELLYLLLNFSFSAFHLGVEDEVEEVSQKVFFRFLRVVGHFVYGGRLCDEPHLFLTSEAIASFVPCVTLNNQSCIEGRPELLDRKSIRLNLSIKVSKVQPECVESGVFLQLVGLNFVIFALKWWVD